MGTKIIEKEEVTLIKTDIPSDYHCNCEYCKNFEGVLKRKDGSYYKKTDRRSYYNPLSEKVHVAKTPLHIARWAVQTYTNEGDWVIDPTIGIGTTAVESIIQKRNAGGMELEFYDALMENVNYTNYWGMDTLIYKGDARNILKTLNKKSFFNLMVTNPPYSGDENQYGFKGYKKAYDRGNNNNIAFLNEGEEYYKTMKDIYEQCNTMLKKGSYIVLGVKDMVRNKKPYLLHNFLGKILSEIFVYKYMVLLPHYPTTLFMNTYPKKFPGVKIPRYQTILVFKKE